MSKREAEWFVEERLTQSIIGGFFHVYNRMRHGFLESAYSLALEKVLTRKGHAVAREVNVPIHFENEILCYHRLDMLVDRKVIIEIKATKTLPASAARQLRHYLCATHLQVGLLLHFGEEAKFYRVAHNPRGVDR